MVSFRLDSEPNRTLEAMPTPVSDRSPVQGLVDEAGIPLQPLAGSSTGESAPGGGDDGGGRREHDQADDHGDHQLDEGKAGPAGGKTHTHGDHR